MKERWGAVVDRTPPAVLIGTGLLVVLLVFGALALAILRDGDAGLEDLGLAAPEAPAAAGDPDAVEDGGSGSSGDGNPLAAGLSEDGDGGGRDPGSSGSGRAAGVPDAGGATSPSAASAPPAATPERQPSTTVLRTDPTTTTASTTTSSVPQPAPTTTEPTAEEHPGVLSGLLALLGLGG